jgi:endonuclease G
MNFAKMIFNTLILVLTFQNIALGKIEGIIGTSPLNGNPNLIARIPKMTASEIIISRDQYVISYNKFNRAPNWVAWKLEVASMGGSGRTNNFQLDADLENYFTKSNSKFQAVASDEYKGSCFDRGHQTPSADRTASLEDNEATFLMSNMVPQTPFLNRVIWERLESYTRNIVKNSAKRAYIISGPIYDDNYGAIGPNNDIKIPTKEFKLIYFIDEQQIANEINIKNPSIAVIMPNVLKDGSKPDFSKGCRNFDVSLGESLNETIDWQQYKTTLSEIESQSGIKF